MCAVANRSATLARPVPRSHALRLALCWHSHALRLALCWHSHALRLALWRQVGASVIVTSESVLPSAIEAIAISEREIQGLIAVPKELSQPAPDGWLVASQLLAPHRSRLPRVSEGLDFVAQLWALVAPTPLDASFPLFALYTSGSTGKPKGIVHTHGGYQVGHLPRSPAFSHLLSPSHTFSRHLPGLIATYLPCLTSPYLA